MLLIRFVLPPRRRLSLLGDARRRDRAWRIAAAQRELREELGLVLPLRGPVHHASGTFEFKERQVDNVDAFYLAHFPGGTITLDGVDAEERSVLKEVRWWTADEIDASADPVYLPDLADAVRRLGRR